MQLATRRVLVLALCVAAVVLAGLMFPATGIGEFPSEGAGAVAGPGDDGPGTAGPPGTVAGTDATPEPGDESTRTQSTPRPDDGPDAGTQTEPGESSNSTATPSATATPTPTPTPTPAGPSDTDDRGVVAVLLGASLWWLLVGLFVVVLPCVTLEGKARGWPLFRRLPVPSVSLVAAARRIPQTTTSVLVDVSGSVPRLVSGLGDALTAGSRGLGVAVSGLARAVGTLVVSVPGALAGVLAAILDVSLFGGSDTTVGGLPDDERVQSDEVGSATPAADESDEPPSTVEEAWVAMVERLPAGSHRAETKTPMELARAAVDHGLPAEPVYALTDAFRQVAYGGASATEDRTNRALAALERVRDALEGDE